MLKHGVNKAKNTIRAEQQYQRNYNMNSWSSFSVCLGDTCSLAKSVRKN